MKAGLLRHPTTLAKLLSGACLLLVGLAGARADSESGSNSEGEAQLVLRYRYEHVDQATFAEDARASTLLARLNYRSAERNGLSFFAEVDSVQPLGSERYNSGAGTSGPNRSQFPVVADPDGTELNQAYLQYSGWSETMLRLGRIRVNFDNQRFVGGVGWRQNEQTYDGLLLTQSSLPQTTLSYLYIDNVNRIFGEDVAAGDHESSSHLLNVRRAFENAGKLVGYLYLIDNDDAPAFSTSTAGLRWTGSTTLADAALNYTFEWATQRDNSNNPVDFSAHYYTADASWNLSPVGFLAGVEVLAGDRRRGGAAFRTPLATLHKFNGWADLFLTTPGAGLEDIFVGITGRIGPVNLRALHHHFSAEDGGEDFGKELDLIATARVGNRYDLMIKFADFKADGPGFADTDKLWLMLTASY